MGNILNDIVDEIDIKPNKSKIYIKWIIGIASSLIAIAFVFGQFKSSFFTKIDNIETGLKENTEAISFMENEMNDGFKVVDYKIDKIYNDAFSMFNDYQVYNKKQLELVVDYGQENKDLLKRMLDLNTTENRQNVELRLEQIKNNNFDYQSVINVNKIKPDYIKLEFFVTVNGNDTIFNVIGATNNYINKIDRDKYILGDIIENSDNPILFDLSYRNK